MSLNIPVNDGTARLSRNSDVIPGNTDMTVTFWAQYVGVLAGDYRDFFHQQNNAYDEWAGLYSQNTITNPYDVYVSVGDTGGQSDSIPSDTFSPNIWIPMAYVRSGTNHKIYANWELVSQVTRDIDATTITEEYIGNDGFSQGGIRVRNFRMWDAALTLSEITTEWSSDTVVKTANLWLNTPLLTDGDDISGNGRDWTVNGAATFVSGSPYLTDADLPFSVTLDPQDADDFYEFYYQAEETKVIGGFAGVDSASGNYDPLLTVEWLDGSNWNVVNVLTGIKQRPIEIPVNAGLFYKIRIENFESNPPGRDVIFNLYEGPDNIPANVAGVVFITDDQVNPEFTIGALLNPVTGEIYKEVRGVIESENGVSDPSTGHIIITSKNPNLGKVYFYDNTLTEINVDTTTLSSSGQNRPPVSNSDNFFYAAQYVSGDGTIRIRRWDFDGNLDGTQWDIPLPTDWLQVNNIAVSRDDTKLYYDFTPSSGFGSTVNVVKVWDLQNDIALPDFVTTESTNNRRNWDILYSNDNFVYLGILEGVEVDDSSFIRKYDTSGNLVLEIELDITKGILDHFAFDTVQTRLVVWQQIHEDPSDPEKRLFTFSKYNSSTGALISENEDVDDFTEGTGSLTAFGSTPTKDFGAPNSCPLIVLFNPEVPPPNPLSGIYKIVPWSRKTNDTLYTSLDPIGTEDRAIPEPFGSGPLLGN